MLSSDAYLKFSEDDFLRGRRLNPRTADGETRAATCANLGSDFDFSQKPRAPVLLPLHPPFSRDAGA